MKNQPRVTLIITDRIMINDKVPLDQLLVPLKITRCFSPKTPKCDVFMRDVTFQPKCDVFISDNI